MFLLFFLYMDIDNIPLCVDDVVYYNLEPYGIDVLFRARITRITDKTTISLRWLQDGRQHEIYGDREWFHDEWTGMLSEYIVGIVSHMAPGVPELRFFK